MLLYRKVGTQWFPDVELIIATEFDSSNKSDFSLDGDTLVAVVENKIHIFNRYDYGWRKEGVLLEPFDIASGYLESVAVFDNAMLVGGVNDSAFYTADNGTWTLQQIVPRGGSVGLNDTRGIIADFDVAYHFV